MEPIKATSENGPVPTNGKHKIHVPISAFESRASRMLKAALKYENTNTTNKTPLKERAPTLPDRQVATTVLQPTQQVDMATNRKRSPRNTVAFSNPVVSQEHVYEPTYLDEIRDYDSDVEEGQPMDTDMPSGTIELSSPVKQADPEKRDVVNYTKDNTKKGYGGLAADDDDDDDDLFVMSRSEEVVARRARIIDRVAPKNPPKRNYEAMQESDNEEEDSSSTNKQTGTKEPSHGGLFQSPKVAKIAPYFDDRPRERRAAESRSMQKNRAKSQAQNDNQRSRGFSTGKSYLQRNSGEFNINEKNRKQPPMNLHPHERVTELLSYKKVSSPKLGDRNVINKAETTKATSDENCTPEQQIPGYFSWFTTFITNQMNKLIF